MGALEARAGLPNQVLGKYFPVQLELCTNIFGECKVEEKLYLGVREHKRLNTTAVVHVHVRSGPNCLNVKKLIIVDCLFSSCLAKFVLDTSVQYMYNCSFESSLSSLLSYNIRKSQHINSS
jgi:hypothetical protein